MENKNENNDKLNGLEEQPTTVQQSIPPASASPQPVEVIQPSPSKFGGRKKLIIIAISLVLILLIGTATYFITHRTNSRAAQSSTRVVKIGLLAALSGDSVSAGNDRKRAISLAKKDLNLQNVDIQLVSRDSNCEEAKAVKGFDEMVSKDHVIGVIGDDCSTSTLAAAKEAEKMHVVLISPSATSPAISEAGDYIFRTVPSDAQQGKFAANLISGKGFHKVAVIHEDGDYGEGLASSFASNFQTDGGTIVDNQVFVANSIDIATQMQHIKATNPDAIYVISADVNSDTAIMLKIKELNIKASIYGSEAMKIDGFIQDAGDAAEGLTITSLTDGTKAYKEEYRAEYNVEANNYTAQTYDAYKALALAIKNGANTGTQIKDQFKSLKFEGASGSVSFDANGDVPGNYEVVTVKNKQFVLQAQ